MLDEIDFFSQWHVSVSGPFNFTVYLALYIDFKVANVQWINFLNTLQFYGWKHFWNIFILWPTFLEFLSILESIAVTIISSYHFVGDGHFSPIGGYHPDSDLVLILDTARFKYPPHWVKLATLCESMKALDPQTGRFVNRTCFFIAK